MKNGIELVDPVDRDEVVAGARLDVKVPALDSVAAAEELKLFAALDKLEEIEDDEERLPDCDVPVVGPPTATGCPSEDEFIDAVELADTCVDVIEVVLAVVTTDEVEVAST